MQAAAQPRAIWRSAMPEGAFGLLDTIPALRVDCGGCGALASHPCLDGDGLPCNPHHERSRLAWERGFL